MFSIDEAEQELENLNLEWSLTGDNVLTRVFNFDDFEQALDFVNQVGKLAEEEGHHPDIELSWGKVVIKLTTHSEGGLTEKDFQLAGKIDKL